MRHVHPLGHGGVRLHENIIDIQTLNILQSTFVAPSCCLAPRSPTVVCALSCSGYSDGRTQVPMSTQLSGGLGKPFCKVPQGFSPVFLQQPKKDKRSLNLVAVYVTFLIET